MLQAGLLAASTSASAGEWKASAQRQVSAWSTLSQAERGTDSHLEADTDVRVVYSVLLSGRLVQLHLQAEHRRRRESTVLSLLHADPCDRLCRPHVWRVQVSDLDL